jgi:hypothetical protein
MGANRVSEFDNGLCQWVWMACGGGRGTSIDDDPNPAVRRPVTQAKRDKSSRIRKGAALHRSLARERGRRVRFRAGRRVEGGALRGSPPCAPSFTAKDVDGAAPRHRRHSTDTAIWKYIPSQ